MIKPFATALLCTALLGACANQQQITHQGQSFRAVVKDVDKQRDRFIVSVRNPERSFVGARLAAHQGGTRYCVRNYGSSDIRWNAHPFDFDVAPPIVDGKLTYAGICPQAQRIVR